MNVCLFGDDSVAVVDLKKQLSAWDARITVLEEFSTNLDKYLVSLTRSHGSFRMELDSALAAIARGERLIRGFSDRV